MSGFEMQVLPGYAGMSGPQRETLLQLGERGELERTVYVRRSSAGAWLATDKRSAFVITVDGEHDRIAVPSLPSTGG